MGQTKKIKIKFCKQYGRNKKSCQGGPVRENEPIGGGRVTSGGNRASSTGRDSGSIEVFGGFGGGDIGFVRSGRRSNEKRDKSSRASGRHAVREGRGSNKSCDRSNKAASRERR